MENIKKKDLLSSIPFKFIENNGFMDESINFALTLKKYKILFLENQVILILREDKKREKSQEVTDQTNDISYKKNILNWLRKKTKNKYIKEENTNIKVIKIKFNNYNKDVKILGAEKSNSNISYIKGTDETKWKDSINSFDKIKYEEIYNGIDLVFYENNKQLEFDFVVRPQANIKDINISIEGSSKSELDSSGSLNISLDQSTVFIHAPKSYQKTNQNLRNVNSYIKYKNNNITFEVDEYDKDVELIIDPILEFSTLLGSSYEDHCTSIAVDNNENIYIAGYTWSVGYENQLADPNFNANFDIFITKINKFGSLVFTTYIGGSSTDYCNSIQVDEQGSVYITGKTNSNDFPLKNAIQNYSNNQGGYDTFISKIRVSEHDNTGFEVGQLSFSTYFGGSNDDCANAIVIKSINNVYITGTTNSPDFRNDNLSYTFQGGTDIFIAQININEEPGNIGTIEYSTILGGTDGGSNAIALDDSSNVYIAGYANTLDFPDTNNSSSSFNGLEAIYILKMDDSKNISYAKYMGSDGYNEATSLVVDNNEKVYLLANNKLDSISNNIVNLYVLDSNGDSTMKKVIDGNGNTFATSVVLDENDFIYVAGYTNSSNLALKNALFNYSGLVDAYLMKMDKTGKIRFSTYLGGTDNDFANGIAIDNKGNIYLAGDTLSKDFPITNEIEKYQGDYDAFVSKIVQARYLYLGNIDTLMTVRKEYIPYAKCREVLCNSNVAAIEELDIRAQIMNTMAKTTEICKTQSIPVFYQYKEVMLNVFANYCLSLFTTNEYSDELKIYNVSENSIVAGADFGCIEMTDLDPNPTDFELVINPVCTVLPEDEFENYYAFKVKGTIGLEYRGDLNE